VRRPWYIRPDEWLLRGGWHRERDLIRHARLRLCGVAAIAITAIVFLVGVADHPASPGEVLQTRGGLHNGE